MRLTDFLIIGGGIIGVSVARELKRRYAECSVTLLEKEADFGLHASGRNSGVIHAGFYYSADSLKARLTRQGNLRLHEYCADHAIPVNRCGKLVVARGEADLERIDELLRRGACNDVPLEPVSEAEAAKIEPRAKTHRRAIFSPTTSSADPRQVMHCMLQNARDEGVQPLAGVRYLGRSGATLRTSAGDFQAGYVVNAAGLYADTVARGFGFSEHYRIIPFKGLYLYSDEPPGSFKTHIYPVPDLRNPFLGVHFTITAAGHAKIGPTAIPALWREQYQGLAGFHPGEMADIGSRLLKLWLRAGFDFRSLAREEIRKYSRRRMVELAAEMAHGIESTQFVRWGKPGIRAQLLDVRSDKLVMDFVIEGDDRSLHVLNAVSPGWTCSMPFAEHVCEMIEGHLGGPVQIVAAGIDGLGVS